MSRSAVANGHVLAKILLGKYIGSRCGSGQILFGAQDTVGQKLQAKKHRRHGHFQPAPQSKKYNNQPIMHWDGMFDLNLSPAIVSHLANTQTL